MTLIMCMIFHTAEISGRFCMAFKQQHLLFQPFVSAICQSICVALRQFRIQCDSPFLLHQIANIFRRFFSLSINMHHWHRTRFHFNVLLLTIVTNGLRQEKFDQSMCMCIILDLCLNIVHFALTQWKYPKKMQKYLISYLLFTSKKKRRTIVEY